MKHARKLLPIVALLLSALVIPVHTASAEVRYTMTVIPGLTPDSAVMPYGINSSGQVAGLSQQAGVNQAILWDGTHSINLGTLPGQSQAYAYAINAFANVIGVSSTNPAIDQRAFLWSAGQMTDLGVLPGLTASAAWGINASGQVVGNCFGGGGKARGFLCSGGQMTALDPLPGGTITQAFAINDAGQIAGASDTSTGPAHAVMFSGTTATDLGTLGGARSSPRGINNLGQVVGTSDTAEGSQQGFLYTGGPMIDLGGLLGTTQSSATGINNCGEVIGQFWVGSMGHAFLYSNGVAVDLNSLVDLPAGWVLVGAVAINDRGQITAAGVTASWDSFACVLTPVPEPMSISILAIGLLTVTLRGRQR